MKLGIKRKKLVLIIGIILAIGILLAIPLIMFDYDAENNIWLIKYDIRNEYAYKVYEDHIELVLYWGEDNEVHVPETLWERPVTVIGVDCFSYIFPLQKVYLTENITEIGDYAFFCNSNLKEIVNGDNVEKVGNCAFAFSEKLETVELGDKLLYIGESAFSNCDKLEILAPQMRLISIGADAFHGSGITEFEFPAQTEIGEDAFEYTEWLDKREQE